MSTSQLIELTRKSLGEMTYPFGIPLTGKSESMVIHTLENSSTSNLHGIGETTRGQLGVQNSTKYNFTEIKSINPFGFSAFLPNILLLAGGDKFHSFVYRDTDVITQDFVYTWGTNPSYELGRGGKDADTCENLIQSQTGPGKINTTFLFTGSDSIRMIDSGYNHTNVVTNSNKVVNWGDNQYGQLGRLPGIQDPTNFGLEPDEVTFTLGGGNNVHSIYGGGTHSVILTNQGNVFAFGNNNYRQLGISDGVTDYSANPIQIPLTNVIQIAVGENFTAALREDGTIWGWGSDSHGQLTPGLSGVDPTRVILTPTQIGSLDDIVHISSGKNHIVALRQNGSIVGYGDNQYSQCSTPTTNLNYTYVFAIRNNTFIVDLEGSIYGFGQGVNDGSYLLGNTQNTTGTPVLITTSPTINVNLTATYIEYLSMNYLQTSAESTLRTPQFDEDVILSSTEYIYDRNALRTLNCIEQSLDVPYARPRFKSYREKQLYERALFLKDRCCLPH